MQSARRAALRLDVIDAKSPYFRIHNSAELLVETPLLHESCRLRTSHVVSLLHLQLHPLVSDHQLSLDSHRERHRNGAAYRIKLAF